MFLEKMKRVSKNHPCPICWKPDWCLVTEDASAAICARIEDGSVKKCGDAGWLHILSESRHKQYKFQGNKRRTLRSIRANRSQTKSFAHLAQRHQQQLTPDKLDSIANMLGVSTQSLRGLNTGWDGEAYTFPMSDSQGKIIGIRRRFPTGNKVSVRGSKMGLFIPAELSSNGPLLICEGPTDTAAALDLDFAAIGRPNCNSRIEMTAKAARGRREIVIVGDNDTQGKAGAKKLADALVLHYTSVKVVYPPDGINDLRQWLKAGLSKEVLLNLIQRTTPIEIRINFKD